MYCFLQTCVKTRLRLGAGELLELRKSKSELYALDGVQVLRTLYFKNGG